MKKITIATGKVPISLIEDLINEIMKTNAIDLAKTYGFLLCLNAEKDFEMSANEGQTK